MSIEPDEDGLSRQVDDLDAARSFISAFKYSVILWILIGMVIYYVW